jgi:hypothetical protein
MSAMYLQNKYTTWYYCIINNATNRVLNSYTETHHIIPRSLGGSDEKTNLATLTAREHFICHWLLTKMTINENKIKMLLALQCMRREGKKQQRYSTAITSRVYEKLKIKLKNWQSERYSGNGNPMFGRSAIIEQNIRWYNNGIDNLYVPAGTEPVGFNPGRIVKWNYTREQPKHRCVSPTGEIFNSLQDAATAYNISVGALRERIRRNENNSKFRKNKSYWSFYSDEKIN